MKSNQLHDLWTSPDNTRLTSKQFSFRLAYPKSVKDTLTDKETAILRNLVKEL
ncbi:MAG: hypothetical protein Q8K12_18420 [Thiobacillus sp.]|nr:hypothetical protein [Thiobacillus sp.]